MKVAGQHSNFSEVAWMPHRWFSERVCARVRVKPRIKRFWILILFILINISRTYYWFDAT
jgi:hypothetical protein